jgi:hypothetical protein
MGNLGQHLQARRVDPVIVGNKYAHAAALCVLTRS